MTPKWEAADYRNDLPCLPSRVPSPTLRGAGRYQGVKAAYLWGF